MTSKEERWTKDENTRNANAEDDENRSFLRKEKPKKLRIHSTSNDFLPNDGSSSLVAAMEQNNYAETFLAKKGNPLVTVVVVFFRNRHCIDY